MAGSTDGEPWLAYADGLLQREGLRCRVGEGIPPRDFAGLYIDHDEVDRILTSLPGLDGPSPERVQPVVETVEPRLRELREAFNEWLGHGEGTFARLARSARLSPQEAEVLAVAAAVELAPQRQRLVAYIQDSVHLPRLSLAIVARLFGPGHVGVCALAPGGRLRRTGLVDVDVDGPWATRMAELAPRVAWALVGDSSPDPALPAGAAVREAPDTDPDGVGLLLVPGGDRASRRELALRACAGTRFLVAPTPSDGGQWRALTREATVGGLSVIVELDGALPVDGRAAIDDAEHLAWALCSPRPLRLDTLPRRDWRERPAPAVTTGTPTLAGAAGRGPEPDDHGHRLTPTQWELVETALSGTGGDLDAAVRRLASGELDDLAVQVQPQRVWDDLVLPDDQTTQLRELCARYRHRLTVYDRWGFRASPSTGLVAAFSGPSGTGKTLAAEVLAGELGLDLYKIDLSSVVSKYIGETEKNLERIFSAAAAANVVLFFDEADALFGKRSEVSDAHDRYANIEVSYLLQRLEAHDGVVVLATNLQGNVDQAFLRRIHVIVEFPLPDEEQRRAIWERSFPPGCPCADLDLAHLARQFKLAGGSIRNAAHGAAFLAAERDSAVSMELVILALQRELKKLGRLHHTADPGRYVQWTNEGAGC